MKRIVYLLLNILPAVFMVLGWVILLAGNDLSVLPCGAVTSVVMAVISVSVPLAVLGIALYVLLYGLWFVSLFFAKKGKHWAMIVGTLVLCFDMAASVVFTLFSWWFLVAAALDAGMIAALWRMTYLAQKA